MDEVNSIAVELSLGGHVNGGSHMLPHAKPLEQCPAQAVEFVHRINIFIGPVNDWALVLELGNTWPTSWPSWNGHSSGGHCPSWLKPGLVRSPRESGELESELVVMKAGSQERRGPK